ncbi:MAG: hypothetical protein JW810_08300, partial [Sedimentisphaerales bacterium]|nr:hypothetical protein [Sedimentisphaerales bacterium]
MLDIETIEQNLEKLMRIEAALKVKFARGEISEEQYKQNLARVDQEQKKWKSQLEDSIADMIFQDADAPAPGPVGSSDPLAQTLQQRHADQQPLQPDEIDPAIKIIDIKRGLQDEARALEIKFDYQDTSCKAIINNKEGRWHFSTQGQTLYLIQFVSALHKSQRFAEVFEKEVSRHPDAWFNVVVKGRDFEENDKQKNSKDNFPEICRQILQRHAHQLPGGEAHK